MPSVTLTFTIDTNPMQIAAVGACQIRLNERILNQFDRIIFGSFERTVLACPAWNTKALAMCTNSMCTTAEWTALFQITRVPEIARIALAAIVKAHSVIGTVFRACVIAFFAGRSTKCVYAEAFPPDTYT